MLGALQFIIVVPVIFVIPGVGGVMFCVKVIVCDTGHPFGSTIFTVYKPGWVIEFVSFNGVEPPVQAYVTPPVACNTIVGFVHVNIVVPVIFKICTGNGLKVVATVPVD
jgi:hypothetical protein